MQATRRFNIGFSRPLIILILCLISAPLRAADAPTPPVPTEVDALLQKAKDAADMNKPAEVFKLLDQAVAAGPKDTRPLIFRAGMRQHVKDWAGAVADADKVMEIDPTRKDVQGARAIAHFMLGHIKESVVDFDAYVASLPGGVSPNQWQRGIALYYAGRFEDGVKQFEEHQKVNPDDVENSAWHFFCMAKWKGLKAARDSVIPSAGDDRVPMMKVLEMLRGTATPEDVIGTAGAGNLRQKTLNRQLFYAHLYVGLYYDSIGEGAKAKEHIKTAAEKYVVPDYMYDVAKVHMMGAEKK